MNKKYLLDTNIISEFSKEIPNLNVLHFYDLRKKLCAMSAITWQELQYGVQRLPEGKKKRFLEKCMNEYKEDIEIISYDSFSAEICGKLQAEAEKLGTPLPYGDSQIAATAISNGMVLVTHNVSDFDCIKEKSFLKVEDWFA